MTVAQPAHGGGAERMGGGPGWHLAEWTLGIIGVIGVLMGLFTLFASDRSSIGLGGDWSWEVGEIATPTRYALLVGGAALLVAAITMFVIGRSRARPASRLDRASSELIWHGGIFLAVNAFIWLQDIAMGGGVEYAYWVTIPWGVGLIVHAITYAAERRTAA